jgi:hypothetical protein
MIDSMKSLIEAARAPLAKPSVPAAYESINDLPLALRRSMVRMYRDGMSPRQIAIHYALPEQWVQLFVEVPPGASRH